MSAFELTVAVPADARFSGTLTALAAQVARQAGCDAGTAAEFGVEVGEALHGCIRASTGAGAATVGLVFRRQADEVEAVLTLTPDPGTADHRVRVARPAPADV